MNFFSFLEHEGELDVENIFHVWALNFVYHLRISRELTVFKRQWNAHGLRTCNHQSPEQLFIAGVLDKLSSDVSSVGDISDKAVRVSYNHTKSEMSISEENQIELRGMVNPLFDSMDDVNGIMLYTQAIDFVVSKHVQ